MIFFSQNPRFYAYNQGRFRIYAVWLRLLALDPYHHWIVKGDDCCTIRTMFRRYYFFIILGFITLLLFSPVIFKGMVPIPADYMLTWYEPWKTANSVNGVPAIPHKPVVDDAFRHLYPLRVVAARIAQTGVMPLWNPYNAAGTPLLAIMHPGYLTPFGIFFLFLSPTIAWTLYVMFQPVVLGIATYWYARKLQMSNLSAVFTSVTLVLSGFSIVRLEYGEFLYVLAGLPLLLGIVEVFKKTLGSNGLFAVPAVVGFMMLSGQPHMIIYVLGIFVLYALCRLPFIQTMQVGAFAILGVGISAAQLLPSLELYSLSTINRQSSAFIFDRFLLPISHLITVIIPNYFGNQATYNYFGPHDYTETVAYVGLLPVFFAFIALRYVRTPIVRFFLTVTVISIVTTLQWFGAKLFFSLPIPVLSSDVPSRVFVLTTFSLAILGGIGISAWETLPWEKTRSWLIWFSAILGAILIGTGVLYWLHVACPPTVSGCRMVSLRTTLIEAAGFGVFVIATLLAFRVRGARPLGLGGALIVIFFLGIYNAQKFLPFAPRERVFPQVPVFSAIAKEVGVSRYFGIGSADFRTNLTTYYGLYSLQYFDPLHIRRYAELVSFVNSGDRLKDIRRSDVNIISDATVSAEIAARRQRFLDLTGTAALVTKKTDGLAALSDLLWEDANWQVSKRQSSLPRAYLVTHLTIETDPDRELAGMFAKETDFTSTAFVDASVLFVPDNLPGIKRVHITEYTPNKVSIDVETPSDAFLVLSDTYYPGWKARVDGKQMDIYRTNYTFRGVVVPKGAHVVTFSYEPDSLKFGAALSVLSVTIWVGFVLLRRKK